MKIEVLVLVVRSCNMTSSVHMNIADSQSRLRQRENQYAFKKEAL